MTKINLEYFGMPGSGSTVKEAKANAGQAIEAALKGDYSPILVRWRNCISIASRDPYGWGYRFVYSSEPVLTVSHCSTGFKDVDAVMVAMLNHIADLERLSAADPFPSELFSRLNRNQRQDAEREYNSRTKSYQETEDAKALGKVVDSRNWDPEAGDPPENPKL